MRRLLVAVLGFAAVAGHACASDAGAITADEPLMVAAASDLQPAFEELGRRFEADAGEEVVFHFGSSGQLAQQAIEGAPMDVFASANVSFVEDVIAAGRGDVTTQTTYAFGRIVLWSRGDSWGDWDDLSDLAAEDGLVNLAIANPEHAPYGLAAEQALRTTGSWDAVEDRLVFGENVSDTQRLAASGNADAAIVALSLALAADERGDHGTWSLIDAGLHEPLQQDLVVVAERTDRADLAERFIDLVGSDEGRDVMRRSGFLLPDEEAPAVWGG